MLGFSITHDQLRAIASLTAAASRDDITPIITGIQVTITGDTLTAVTTDRYRVAELTFPLPADRSAAFGNDEDHAGDFPPIVIPAAFLARIVKQLPRRPLTPTATIAVIVADNDPTTVTMRDRIAGFESTDATIRGNYPPVARLFPDTANAKPYDGSVRLNAAYLATLDKLTLPSDIGARGPQKCYDMTTQTGDNPNRPAPILFTRTDIRHGDGDSAQLRYLVQPNLILR